MNANSSARSTVQVADNDGPIRTVDSRLLRIAGDEICTYASTRGFVPAQSKAISGHLLLDPRTPGLTALNLGGDRFRDGGS